MLCLFMVGVDGSLVNVILPELRAVFSVTMAQSTLLATVYLATLAAFQLFFGRVADLLGATRLFLVGIVFFGLGSAGCALSHSFLHMLLGRALQGLGGAMLSASFGAVILQNFPKEQRGQVIGTAMLFISVGGLVGPPLGGFLAEQVSWHWAFLINLPGCAVAVWALLPALGGSIVPHWQKRLDPAGSALSALVLLSLPAGLHYFALPAGQRQPGAPLVLLGLLALAVFVMVERRVEHPLVDVSLFRDRALVALFGLKILLFGALNGVSLIFPFFISAQPGLGVAEAGWLMLFSAVAMAIATPLAGRQVDRIGAYPLLLASGLALGLAALASLGLGPQAPLGGIALSLAALGGAAAIGMVASSVAVLNSAKAGQEGIFSALNSVVSPIGGALGLSVFSLLYENDSTLAGSSRGFHNSLLGVLVCALGICVLAKAYQLTHTKAKPAMENNSV